MFSFHYYYISTLHKIRYLKTKFIPKLISFKFPLRVVYVLRPAAMKRSILVFVCCRCWCCLAFKRKKTRRCWLLIFSRPQITKLCSNHYGFFFCSHFVFRFSLKWCHLIFSLPLIAFWINFNAWITKTKQQQQQKLS